MCNIGPWRSLASALAWGARGPEFKSRRPDQSFQRLTGPGPSQCLRLESNWSPNPGLRRLRFPSTPNNGSNSLGLSPPMRTRQTRHFGDKPLIPQGRSMSGRPKKPAINPTFPAKNPTINRRLGADAIRFSQSSHYSESPRPHVAAYDAQFLAAAMQRNSTATDPWMAWL
jgi:hypothetical protein